MLFLPRRSARLNNLVEKQPRNRKSRRCVLHSLEIQRMRPPPNAWREVWDCMEMSCKQELALIETDTLDDTLDTYLRKHRYNNFVFAHYYPRGVYVMVLFFFLTKDGVPMPLATTKPDQTKPNLFFSYNCDFVGFAQIAVAKCYWRRPF